MKKGFACGVFDLFHAGHVLMLEECKAHCDYLIVGLNSALKFDKAVNSRKNSPVFAIEHRKLILEACRYVDNVIIYNNEFELSEILSKEKIDIRFLGEDYKGKVITAPHAVKEIYYTDRSHGLSTSYYRKVIKEELSQK